MVPDGKEAGSGFGSSLSISGDRLVAGAPEAGAGKAYVYELAGNRATLIRTAINPGRGNGFGVSVKLSGNRLLVSTTFSSETWVYDLSDADHDGLSDAVEIGLEPLGFDWRRAQPELVSVLSNFAFSGGLVTQEQLRGMKVGTVLRRDGDGRFRLVLDLRRSPDLRDFHDFPLHPAEVSITAEGDLEIRFEDEAEADFFLFEAR